MKVVRNTNRKFIHSLDDRTSSRPDLSRIKKSTPRTKNRLGYIWSLYQWPQRPEVTHSVSVRVKATDGSEDEDG